MKVGIFFGCFIPLHSGHENIICRALEENDCLILGLCGYDGDRGQNYIPFRDRIALMTKIYGHRKNITLSVVDDKKIGLTGTFSVDAWRTWCKELFACGYDPHDERIKYTWYSGDSDYLEKIRQIYPEHHFILVSRDIIPISGTQIREDTMHYKNCIHPRYRDYKIVGRKPTVLTVG